MIFFLNFEIRTEYHFACSTGSIFRYLVRGIGLVVNRHNRKRIVMYTIQHRSIISHAKIAHSNITVYSAFGMMNPDRDPHSVAG